MTDNTQSKENQLHTEAIVSNKRIAKNTVLLYIRMIVMIIIGLYTSRVVLQVLGVKDYGVYNAVGGVVTMFSILSNSLSTAVSRYLTFELGRGDKNKLREVFSSSINVQVTIALIIVILGGLIGGWFLNCHMNIPQERMEAANWVLYCSLLSFAVGLISIPYTATITAHERMDVYAYMTILEAVLKLVIVFALYLSPFDKLTSYAILLLIVSIIIRVIYGVFCEKHFSECKYTWNPNKKLLKELSSFAGWTFFGNASWVFNTQGINILMNIFFGVTVNAARGIAMQVESLVTQLVNNFMTALNPQITKSYASGDLENMHQLICRGAKFSFFLMLVLAIPISLETENILYLWLGKVPEFSVIFVRLTFLSIISTVLGNTLVTGQLATGKVKKYQITMTLIGVWVFPLTWLAYQLGGSPVWAYVFFIIIYFALVFVRLYMVKDLIKLSWRRYLNEVIVKSIFVGVISLIAPFACYIIMPHSILRTFVVFLVSFISCGIVIYWLGMYKQERLAIKKMITKKIFSI